jgi:hypothetical protein
VTVFDPNLVSIYYDVGVYRSSLINNTDTLFSSFIWSNLYEGEFEIQFFAEDVFGQINDTYTLKLYKDTGAPTITINSPFANSIHAINAPDFNISVSKYNLDKVWYTLFGFPDNYIINELNGTINQIAWDYFGDGSVTIRFFANDTTGNTRIQDVIVRKDISAPTITIDQPTEGTIWDLPPIIKVFVFDPNLDTIWYRIGITSLRLSNNTEQQIDDIIWDNLVQGEFYLYISANDSLGNINDSYYLTLYKDTLAPNITINLPAENQEVGEIAPQYDVTIIEDNLDTRWYTLDGGLTNITFNRKIGQIDQEVWSETWETHADGELITIYFYANDTLGHLGYQKVVTIVKKPSELFEIKNPIMLISSGAVGGILVITTISVTKNKKFKRLDKKQKKKVNAILYLSSLITVLLLLTSIF